MIPGWNLKSAVFANAKAKNHLCGDCLDRLLELQVLALNVPALAKPQIVGPKVSIFNKFPQVILMHSEV